MPSPEKTPPFPIISAAIARIIEDKFTAVLITLIEGPTNVGSKLLVEPSGSTIGTLGYESLNSSVVQQAARFLDSKDETRAFQVKEFAPEIADLSEARVLFERIEPEPRIVICGAGHVGAALTRLTTLLGYHPTLIDDRGEFVTREHFPDERIELIAAADWFDAVRAAVGDGRGVSVAVVTRGHSEDEACMRAVMVTGADYVGLIGSKRRTNIVLGRLREEGVDDQRLENIHAPVGLDIGAVTPEEVALAIMAEIVAVRRGGAGGSLSSWRRA
ncbi:MAG: XdhC family protein [Acidobacteriota bacterium]|nr:XdhC family protein [Acidobacteriota bacterium]